MRNRKKSSNCVVVLFKKSLPFTLLLLLIVTFTYLSSPFSSLIFNYTPLPAQGSLQRAPCDYTKGEWVRDDLDPLYNGTTCQIIIPLENCMMSGRPDKEYLRWRWKPNQCNLPRFDPETFLDLMKNKHIAFVGDSLARNQFQSLLCMASTVTKPQHIYGELVQRQSSRWMFPSHNATFSTYQSPFLVKWTTKPTHLGSQNAIVLDTIDESWASELRRIDILVIAAGHWFTIPAVYYQENSITGCYALKFCRLVSNFESYRKALKTTFDEIIKRRSEDSDRDLSVFMTTFSPDHFVGDEFSTGTCNRTQPYGENEEIYADEVITEMRRIQIEEVSEARIRSGGMSVLSFEVVDITGSALLRPDGHPGIYALPMDLRGSENAPSDCRHWCLPGPIDTWNQILFDLIVRNEYKSNIKPLL